MIRRLIFYLFLLLVFLFAIGSSSFSRNLLLSLGVLREKIPIAGTGSMYPTFPKADSETDSQRAKETVAIPQMRFYPAGVKFFGKALFSYALQTGDIVEFENEKTKSITKEKYGEEAGFVKRVIGASGDKIELRDGFVLRNGEILDEPYTAKPRSTYGGDVIADCQNVTVPPDSVFVLGDNRKASLDSRFSLGLVNLADIHHYIPLEEQRKTGLTGAWRETAKDASLAHTATLDPLEFVRLLNEERKQNNLPALKYNALLSTSSKRRGEVMIKTDDFSFEATRSSLTLERALKEAGYRNIVSAEVFTRGFFEGAELLENFLEFPQIKKFLFSRDYQDIGLSAVIGDLNSCPVQVVVAHFGGYVPPNYKVSDIKSWEDLIKNLEEVRPSWRSLKEAQGIDQEKIGRLLELFDKRIANAGKVVVRMKANQWLTDEEKILADQDKYLSSEMEKIIADLSKR